MPADEELNTQETTDYSWMDQEEEERKGRGISLFDPAKDVCLIPQWQGEYRGRIVAPPDRSWWMRPSGRHFNVFPKNEDKIVAPGCPLLTHQQFCPICSGIQKARNERRITRDDLRGKQSPLAKKSFLLPFVLYGFKMKPSEDKEIPDFGLLPSLRYLAIPLSMMKKVNKLRNDPDYGGKNLFDLEHGRMVKFTKDDTISGWWSLEVLFNEQPVGRELVATDKWISAHDLVPEETTEDIQKMLLESVRDIPEYIAQFALSIDIEAKQIPVDTAGSSTQEELRKQLDEI